MNMLNRREFLKAATMGIASGTLPGLSYGVEPSMLGKKPDIIMFLIDDMGWRDLSCYVSTFYETPNIDKLLTEFINGMNFYD